jgi:predicted metal-dependent HD superfamily phosphohydrolase
MAISDAQRQKMVSYVQAYLVRTAQSFGHQNALFRATARWTHTLNVLQNLKLILDGERTSAESREICEVAALFHDVDHYTVQLAYHAARGAETAARFLTKEGYDPEFVRRVGETIRQHHRDLDDEIPIADQVHEIVDTLSIEVRLVMDADTLDKIGVSNILQAVLSMGTSRRQLAESAKELTSGWPLQRAKLWKELLTTPTGKALGEERFGFYETFLRQIEAEIVMDDPFPTSAQTQEVAQVS